MNRSAGVAALACALFLLVSGTAQARGLGVEVWTDRGNDAVYQPGDGMTVKVRTSEDAWLLVYEIDTEGYVRVLHPYRGRAEFVEGQRTLQVPDPQDDIELVVQQSVGQSYVVAIASYEPFRPLPGYLRPYSAQEEALGYVGEPDDREGITTEGRIVGDPFVAMERIRRRVLADPEDDESFASSYTSYYVHTEVKYPRYLCYDCHRPNRWSWWDGFDPYYTDCSVFSFRVNWSWYWGPSYWNGHVPYFVYVYRPDCPPRYTRYFESGIWYSAWDGWNRWCELWGNGGLRRFKTAPPANYVPPTRWKDVAVRLPAERRTPPGFLAGGRGVGSRDGISGRLPIGRVRTSRDETRGGSPAGRTRWSEDGRVRKPDAGRAPAVRGDRGSRGGQVQRPERERGERRPTPVYRPREESRPGRDSGSSRRETWRPSSRPQAEAPPAERRREDRPEPRQEHRPSYEPRQPERQPSPPPREAPRVERQRDPSPPPRSEPRPDRGGGRPDFPGHKGKR